MAAGDGLISMKPTSIVHAGTSASINADGGVDFSAVTSLSLNGVFTSAYDNYVIFWRGTRSAANVLYFRLRAAGTDATGANYADQYFKADGGTISAARGTSITQPMISDTGTAENGITMHIYGPALAQPTAYRTVTAASNSGGLMTDFAVTHSLSTAYDGFTWYPSSGSMTGQIHVFAYEE